MNSISMRGIRWILMLLVFACSSVSAQNSPKSNLTWARKGIKVGGWTQVDERWPIGSEPDYFVAVEKGHHFIQVELPNKLETDLIVKLKFYYAYTKVRPFLQIVPCRTNVDILTDRLESPGPGQWHQHEMRINKTDCEKRKELAYNVLLHDPNDLFAWSLLEINSVDSDEPTTEATVFEEEEDPEEVNGTNELMNDLEIDRDGPDSNKASTEKAESTTDNPPKKDHEQTKEPNEETTKRPDEPSTVSDLDKPQSDETSDPTTTEKVEEITTQQSYNDDPQKGDPKQQDGANTYSNNSRPSVDNESSPGDGAEEASDTRKEQNRIPENWRIKRDTKWQTEASDEDQTKSLSRLIRATPAKLKLVCKPGLCDKSLVKHPRFMTIIGSGSFQHNLNPGTTTKPLMYLSTKNQSLTFQVESDDHDFADVNLCLDFNLYMDKNTSMALILDEDPGSKGGQQKLLELFEGGSEGMNWNRVERCISDYMPKLTSATQNEDRGKRILFRDEYQGIHRVKLNMVPRSQVTERQKMIVSMLKYKMFSIKPLPRTLAYLPDVVTDESTEQMWIIDRDGTKKAVHAIVKDANGTKMLQIRDIDPRQKYFDLTSGWIKIEDPELLDSFALFHYKAERADWIKALDFQFQNIDYKPDQWKSERVYTKSAAKSDQNKTIRYEQKTDGATLETGGMKRVDDDQNISAPIRLKGINKKEFRIRLRHHVDDKFSKQEQAHQLNITKLAFGDSCAIDRPYCLNGGQCRPTGISEAKCLCKRGYSGQHCELSQPCEAIYSGNLTGSEFCKSVKAKCANNIPVFRCIWPNDQHYQCKALAGATITTEGYIEGAKEVDEGLDQSRNGRLEQLEAEASKQKQLIIVMSVFMAALILFAIVIVINMIAKLRKSNKRLKTAQIEVHELTRHSTPGTSASAGISSSAARTFGSPVLRNKPAAITTYNNRAFDAAEQ